MRITSSITKPFRYLHVRCYPFCREYTEDVPYPAIAAAGREGFLLNLGTICSAGTNKIVSFCGCNLQAPTADAVVQPVVATSRVYYALRYTAAGRDRVESTAKCPRFLGTIQLNINITSGFEGLLLLGVLVLRTHESAQRTHKGWEYNGAGCIHPAASRLRRFCRSIYRYNRPIYPLIR
jgi:hypothetical protein